MLADETRRGRDWTDPQTALAHDLIGTPAAFRAEAPGLPLDPASLAAREIAGLQTRKLAMSDADALDRNLAMADLSEQSTPELRRLRRYETSLHKRLRWCLHQLHLIPQFAEPNPNLSYLHEPPPEPKAEPESTPSPEPEPEPESPALKPPAPPRRPEPASQKAQARREAKRRRADRLDE